MLWNTYDRPFESWISQARLSPFLDPRVTWKQQYSWGFCKALYTMIGGEDSESVVDFIAKQAFAMADNGAVLSRTQVQSALDCMASTRSWVESSHAIAQL